MSNNPTNWLCWRPGELRWFNGVLQQRFYPYVDTKGKLVAVLDTREPEWRDVPIIEKALGR